MNKSAIATVVALQGAVLASSVAVATTVKQLPAVNSKIARMKADREQFGVRYFGIF